MESNAQLEQMVVTTLRQLPIEQQQEVLNFTESLHQKQQKPQRRSRLKGACAHLGIHITEETITTARQEIWRNFPREFPE
jgi:hypothetical protein